MKQFIETLLNKLAYLYQIYENYIWKNEKENIKLNILIQDNMICFYLYNKFEIIDEFFLTFDQKEQSIYKYISIRVMLNVLGNVLIHNDGYTFYNEKHKPYLNIIINDSNILESAIYITKKQSDEIINNNNLYIEKIYQNIPSKMYPYTFLDSLEKRIEISKKILRW